MTTLTIMLSTIKEPRKSMVHIASDVLFTITTAGYDFDYTGIWNENSFEKR